MRKIVLFTSIFGLLISCKKEVYPPAPEIKNIGIDLSKISKDLVIMNSSIAEIVSALGHEDEIVGVDGSSVYPPSLKSHAKNLGSPRSLNLKILQDLNPDLLLATDKDLLPENIKKLKNSGIKVGIFKQDYSVDGTKKLIQDVAKTLGDQDFQKLNAKIDEDLKKVQPLKKSLKLAHLFYQGKNLMISGIGTPMDQLIVLAGGVNAAKSIEGAQILTPEILKDANPEVLVFYQTDLKKAGGSEGVLNIMGVFDTKAGKNNKIIAMDGVLASSFGPRLGEAVVSLNQLIIDNIQ